MGVLIDRRDLSGAWLIVRRLTAALYYLAIGKVPAAQGRFSSACIARSGIRERWTARCKPPKKMRRLLKERDDGA